MPYDIVYLVDDKGSMQGEINSVIEYCKTIAEILKKNLYYYDFKFGAVFYRDPIDTKGKDKHECFDLTSNIDKFKMIFQELKHQEEMMILKIGLEDMIVLFI